MRALQTDDSLVFKDNGEGVEIYKVIHGSLVQVDYPCVCGHCETREHAIPGKCGEVIIYP